ncbi:MAG: dihydroneopterin aldolase [Coxiellaceae bacterium]|nr:dihydroneopterin aldolase [Coxiellaceae bacterium]
MSRIVISGLIVHAVIGVYAFEQSITQPLTLDLSFSVDIARASLNDDLSDTYDYAAICKSIAVFVDNNPCRLLETFTKRLVDHLTQTFQLMNLTLSVTKRPKDLPNVAGVSVVNKG